MKLEGPPGYRLCSGTLDTFDPGDAWQERTTRRLDKLGIPYQREGMRKLWIPAWAVALGSMSHDEIPADVTDTILWLVHHRNEQDAVNAVALRNLRRAADLAIDLYRTGSGAGNDDKS